jgi:sugar transferase (PEP-CTERM system associated)
MDTGRYPNMIRVFRHYIPRTQLVLCAVESALLFGSVYAAVAIVFHDVSGRLLVGDLWVKALTFTIVTMLLMTMTGLYQRWLRDDMRGLLFRMSVALVLGLVTMVALQNLAPSMSIGAGAFGVSFALAAAGILGFRAAVYHFADSSLFRRRVLVLGSGERAAQMRQLRRRSDYHDMELVGFLALDDERTAIEPERLVGHGRASLPERVAALDIEQMIVAVDEGVELPLSEILECKLSGVEILELSAFFEQQTGRVPTDALEPRRLVFEEGFVQAVVKSYVHRTFDLVLGSLALFFAWPAMLLTALAIVIESRGHGPVFYRQIRIGRGGRHFEILKFRSMRVDAEASGAQWAKLNDDRVTRVGEFIRKSRLDETPQLLNVLRGDMSFVGPRPERPEFVERLSEVVPYYDLRHCINPGITGWAQICYPYGSSDEDARRKHEYDIYYIKNYSVFLDLTILIQTAQVILWGQGAR